MFVRVSVCARALLYVWKTTGRLRVRVGTPRRSSDAGEVHGNGETRDRPQLAKAAYSTSFCRNRGRMGESAGRTVRQVSTQHKVQARRGGLCSGMDYTLTCLQL